MNEVWKSIKNYEGLYQVSNLGRVRSLKVGNIKNLKPRIITGGYFQVGLCKDNKRSFFLVHRLVWEAFIGTIPEGMQVNHIDEDKTNNRLDNLNLLTCKENCNHGTRNKRISKKLKGAKRPEITIRQSKPLTQNTLDGHFVREWMSAAEAGKNGFNHRHISECCLGKRKTHKGYKWMYAEDFFKMLPEI